MSKSIRSPAFVPVVAPTLVDEVTEGDNWIHEIKFDGYRMQIRVDDKVTITSRNDLDWTHRFPFIAQAFAKLPPLIMDGEIISTTDIGASDFGQLQADLSNGRHDRIVYFAFDLMFLKGKDLRALPLLERKKILATFLEKSKIERIMYSEHFDDGAALFKLAGELGLEGVVSKRKDSPYKPSKSNWLKVKIQKTAEYFILGYVPGGRAGISALRLGQRNGNAFDYVGKVGTGFTNEMSETLRRTLDKKITDKPSLTAKLRRPDTKWVKPDLKAKIAFRGVTGDGKLRHPSFKGLGD